ncbi:hypothetical protein [Chryseolinea lacunae]|uniref:DUF1186 domain-containing protein n=1 Tax=Chryseolinea lacunae TaxID=2801331 RepID=A0ABS1KR01_9BACT|nr:hypothetical protein [Chryseolinea lacunae]MBL0741677.1 hypothetical protein [Chryseolinea lacunae]
MSKKQHDKMMQDLQRLLSKQNFQSKEEMEKFLDQLKGQAIPEFEPEASTPEEKAQRLVHEAREVGLNLESDKKVFSALKLDPDCVEAFEFMGDFAMSALQRLIFYRNGMNAGRKKLGVEFFKENMGRFWTIAETRPFMRCMMNYAMSLHDLDEPGAALNILMEMIRLNPTDNQGVRDFIFVYSLEVSKFEIFDQVAALYPTDQSAFTVFTKALYSFKKEGDTPAGREAVETARQINNHVVTLLLSKKELPPQEEYFERGAKNEAVYYAHLAREAWQKTPGAIQWLNAIYLKK